MPPRQNKKQRRCTEYRQEHLPEEHALEQSGNAGKRQDEKTKNRRTARDRIWNRKVQPVFPSPFKIESSVVFRYRKGQRKTKHPNQLPGKYVSKQRRADEVSAQRKDSSTADADEKTEAGALENGTVDGALVIRSVRAGDGRHEQDSNRIGQRAGKQDAGHRHAGVYAISRKRLMGGIAKQLQADRDVGGFDCSEQMQADPRGAQGCSKGKQSGK